MNWLLVRSSVPIIRENLRHDDDFGSITPAFLGSTMHVQFIEKTERKWQTRRLSANFTSVVLYFYLASVWTHTGALSYLRRFIKLLWETHISHCCSRQLKVLVTNCQLKRTLVPITMVLNMSLLLPSTFWPTESKRRTSYPFSATTA